jgi:hypothetical protein
MRAISAQREEYKTSIRFANYPAILPEGFVQSTLVPDRLAMGPLPLRVSITGILRGFAHFPFDVK